MANDWLVYEGSLLPPSDFDAEVLDVDGLIFARRVDGRFADDKLFYATSRSAVVLDGVLLNKVELLAEYEVGSLRELFDLLLEENEVADLLRKLRGPFSGAILTRHTNTLYCFANQTGDTAAYVRKDPSRSMVSASNSMDLLLRTASINGQDSTFNSSAAEYMLSFGYMLDDSTFAQQFKRVLPGEFVAIHRPSSSQVTSTYYQLPESSSFRGSYSEALEAIDASFRRAVSRCFRKDIEYGYPYHLADISGGLDSRMTNWVAKELGFGPITNICFAQSGSAELTNALRVSHELGNECLVMPLDNGGFFRSADEILRANNGAAYYAGITGGRTLLQRLNFSQFGLEHTGQLGDVVLGTFCVDSSSDQKPRVGTERYSTTLDVDFEAIVSSRWSHQESYLMNTRGFLGALSTHLTRKEHTYAVSPFLDVDFMELCFSLPLEWRINHSIYGDWVTSRYPAAAALPSTRVIRANMTRVEWLRWTAKRVRGRFFRDSRRALFRLGLVSSRQSPDGMNPFDYWYDTDQRIRDSIDSLLEKRTNIAPEIDAAIGELINSGRVLDKLLAASVVRTHALYFSPDGALQLESEVTAQT